MTRLAGFGLGRLPRGGAGDTRGTETVIAAAAERLYQELPDDAKRVLADLPDVLGTLRVRTIGARTFVAQLETSSSHDDAEATDRLDEAQGNLADTVTALEAIRLALQRLEDGTGTVHDVSMELAAAREIGEAVDRALEG